MADGGEGRAEAIGGEGWGGAAWGGDGPGGEAMPDYLVRYAGAYLWPAAVWFFDHQPVINTILFGQYLRIMGETLRLLEPERAGRSLQLGAVYGALTPTLAGRIDDLHVIDVAPVQLDAVARKLAAAGRTAQLARMNAEALTYADASFDTVLVFLLLHEMSQAARRRCLKEAIRVLRPGGRLVIAEYGELRGGPRGEPGGELRRGHPFHRIAPIRWLLTTAEPFLGAFWREDLGAVLDECAKAVGRRIGLDEQSDIFGGFYRVARYRVD